MTCAYLFVVFRPSDGHVVGYDVGSEPTSTRRMDEVEAIIQTACAAGYLEAKGKLIRWAAEHHPEIYAHLNP